MDKGLFLISLVVAVFTAQDVWDARCEVGCRREGYDSGKFKPPAACYCYDRYDSLTLTGKTMKAPHRRVASGKITVYTTKERDYYPSE